MKIKQDNNFVNILINDEKETTRAGFEGKKLVSEGYYPHRVDYFRG